MVLKLILAFEAILATVFASKHFAREDSSVLAMSVPGMSLKVPERFDLDSAVVCGTEEGSRAAKVGLFVSFEIPLVRGNRSTSHRKIAILQDAAMNSTKTLGIKLEVVELA